MRCAVAHQSGLSRGTELLTGGAARQSTGGAALDLTFVSLPLHRPSTFALSQLVFVGMDTGFVAAYDRTSGDLIRVLEGHTAAVTGLALSSDGEVLVSSSMDCSVGLWQLRLVCCESRFFCRLCALISSSRPTFHPAGAPSGCHASCVSLLLHIAAAKAGGCGVRLESASQSFEEELKKSGRVSRVV